MLRDVFNAVRKSVKPSPAWGQVTRAIRNKKDPEEDGTVCVVGRDVDQEEFIRRYNMVRATGISSLFFTATSFLVMLFSSNFQQFIFCLLAAFLFGLFYLRYAMILWISRCCWRSWEKRDQQININGSGFLRAVMANPYEVLPLVLNGEAK